MKNRTWYVTRAHQLSVLNPSHPWSIPLRYTAHSRCTALIYGFAGRIGGIAQTCLVYILFAGAVPMRSRCARGVTIAPRSQFAPGIIPSNQTGRAPGFSRRFFAKADRLPYIRYRRKYGRILRIPLPGISERDKYQYKCRSTRRS